MEQIYTGKEAGREVSVIEGMGRRVSQYLKRTNWINTNQEEELQHDLQCGEMNALRELK